MTDADVYYKYKNKVYGLALTLVRNDFDAKDITSDVFLKYLRYIKANNTFKNEKHMERWFITVTRNAVKDFFRANKIKYENQAEEDITDIETVSDDYDEKYDFVKKLECRLSHETVMQKLNARYREVLLEYFDYGYSVKEISGIMNESETNVKTLLFRAKKKYKELSENGGDIND